MYTIPPQSGFCIPTPSQLSQGSIFSSTMVNTVSMFRDTRHTAVLMFDSVHIELFQLRTITCELLMLLVHDNNKMANNNPQTLCSISHRTTSMSGWFY